MSESAELDLQEIRRLAGRKIPGRTEVLVALYNLGATSLDKAKELPPGMNPVSDKEVSDLVGRGYVYRRGANRYFLSGLGNAVAQGAVQLWPNAP
jgi:hypothetical protein